MTQPESQKYKLNDEVVERKIGDDFLVHRFDTDDVFVFNEHANMVLEAVKSGVPHGEIHEYIKQKGFDDAATREAVERTVEHMIREGIIVPDASKPA
jgi:hypothetical protein